LEQAEAPAEFEKVPLLQFVQLVDPPAEDVPAAQVPQIFEPLTAENLPASHETQLESPVEVLKAPAAQTEHTALLLRRPYPMSQMHEAFTSTLLNPVEEPELTYPTVDAHAKHTAASLAPTAGNAWEEIMYRPAEQGMHELSAILPVVPEIWYLPIAQLVQVFVDLAVELDHVPALQDVHAVLPVDEVAV